MQCKPDAKSRRMSCKFRLDPVIARKPALQYAEKALELNGVDDGLRTNTKL